MLQSDPELMTAIKTWKKMLSHAATGHAPIVIQNFSLFSNKLMKCMKHFHPNFNSCHRYEDTL